MFLDLNGIELHDPEETLYSLMMNVAEGKKNEKEVAESLESSPIETEGEDELKIAGKGIAKGS